MSGTTLKTHEHVLGLPGSISRVLTIQHNEQQDDIDEINLLVTELATDHATSVTGVTAIEALVNQLRRDALYATYGNPTFAIDTNFDVKSTEAVYYSNGGTIKTLADNTNFDTGTSKTITGSNWGAAVLSVNSSGTGVVTWASGGGYASEALAIAGLVTSALTTDTIMGYFTNRAHASGFTAGTDALAGGAGGNVSQTTNYYNSINPNVTLIGAALSGSAPATLTAAAVTVGSAKIGNASGTVIDE